jgi:hypothetical protein
MPLKPPPALPTRDIRDFTKWCREALLDGHIETGEIDDHAVTYAKIQQGTALSVLGNATNATADLADIAAAGNDTLLRRTSNALSFGQLTAGMFPAAVVPDSALQADVAIVTTGSYTGTLTGCTTSPTVTVNYRVVGGVVTIWTTSLLSATSNSTACTVTGAPAAIRPTTATTQFAWVLDNGGNTAGSASMSAAGVLTLNTNITGVFTAANTKGLHAQSITYALN